MQKFRKRRPADNSATDSEGESTPYRYKKPTARRKIMDILARRNHSVVELRRKLAVYEYTSAEIEDAIEFAEENKWLSPPQELTKEVTRSLSRKKKSARYIDHFLRDKGLPPAKIDPEAELEKALSIVQMKLAKDSAFDFEEKQKVHRLLTNRGFDSTTIRKVIERK